VTAPELVVVCGPPGVGKSSVARAVADHLDAAVYRTDVVRKELFETPAYTTTETEQVYAAVLDRARTRLADGGRAVLDGTYREARFRVAVAEAAESVGATHTFVRVTCEEPVVRERIAGRDGVSDATFENYLDIREGFEPLEAAHVTVDNSGPLERTRRQVAEALPEP
jgi:predicted kinase